MELRVGTVAIIGKPNAGKSSLINALVREKVSIVSPKPQTTRNNVVGIYNDDDSQIVFVDTPGIHSNADYLSEYMNKSVSQACSDVDLILLLIDGSKKIDDTTIKFINQYKTFDNVILLVTKTDLVNFEKLYPELSKLNELEFLKDILPISSHKNRNLDVLLKMIKENLPVTDENYLMYDRDEYTNKSIKFIIGEIIREKILLNCDEEIPHGVAIVIASYEESHSLVRILADIICEKESHKTILIGKKASMIKKIGMDARRDIEKMLGKQVYLELFVKVKNNWKNNIAILNEIGYNKSSIEEES